MNRAPARLGLLIAALLASSCGESSPADDAGSGDRVTLVSQSSDCSGICTAPYELCFTLAADPPVTATSVTVTGQTLGSGMISAAGTEFCATACWCLGPDGSVLTVETEEATYSVEVGGGPCCG